MVTCAANLVGVWNARQKSARRRAAVSDTTPMPTSDLLGVLSLEIGVGSGLESGAGEKARAMALRLLPALRRALYSSDLKRSALLLVTNIAACMWILFA